MNALPPTRPIFFTSAMFEMPSTIVRKMIGPITILTSFTNTSPSGFICLASSGLNTPSVTPTATAKRTRAVRLWLIRFRFMKGQDRWWRAGAQTGRSSSRRARLFYAAVRPSAGLRAAESREGGAGGHRAARHGEPARDDGDRCAAERYRAANGDRLTRNREPSELVQPARDEDARRGSGARAAEIGDFDI